MALSDVEKLRIELQDNEPGLYFLQDEELEYFLEKNSNSIPRAMLDSAKTILFKLSQRGNDTVDIFSFSDNKSAEQYRLALMLFLRDPLLNPIMKTVQGYVGGVSLSEMRTNNTNPDNNVILRRRYDLPDVPPNVFAVPY
jgi:hypothetical protein